MGCGKHAQLPRWEGDAWELARGDQEEPKGSLARAELVTCDTDTVNGENRRLTWRTFFFFFFFLLTSRYIYPLGLLKSQVSISGPKWHQKSC